MQVSHFLWMLCGHGLELPSPSGSRGPLPKLSVAWAMVRGEGVGLSGPDQDRLWGWARQERLTDSEDE